MHGEIFFKYYIEYSTCKKYPCGTPQAHLCVVQWICPQASVVCPDPLYSGNYQQIEALA